MKCKLKALLAVAVAFIICLSAYAGEIDELKQKQKEAQSKVNSTGGLLKEVRAEKNTALAEIDELDDQLTAVTEDLAFISEQIEITDALILTTETDLACAVEKRENQYNVYKKRVRYMYINGTIGYLDVILKAENVVDLLNRVEYVNRIAENDRTLVARFKETENQIDENLKSVNKAKREYEFLSSQYELKASTLENTILKKSELIERLTADEEAFAQQLSDFEADNKRIEKLIKDAEAAEAKRIAEEKARAAASVYTGGLIGWPVPSSGTITSGYGNRTNPISGKPEFHSGIDIAAAYGASIVAAESGAVVSAGWNGGYGNAVVISHGGGLSTLYAHNSQLLVSVGDVVKKGQVIAKAGSTGYSTGNHLHFEVRVNGAHTGPLKYLKGQ